MTDFDANSSNETVGYQINVVNIKYGVSFLPRNRNRPDSATLDLPEAILKMKDKEGGWQKFVDTVESFAYNTLTRKYGAEVSFCQVFLPLEDR